LIRIISMKLLTVVMLSCGILSPAAFLPAHAADTAAPLAKAAATPAKGSAPVKVTSVEGLTEYRLANGMRVLLFPDASKPTITTNIIYMVGSRHENYGETGMAHLLEHLLFKPSANFGIKKGSRTPVEVLNATGAQFNGTTWFDRTNYYSTFPANDDNLKQMLALEADRMVNAAIDQNDLWNPKTNKGEMTVVRNEFEMGENNPIAATNQRIRSIAFDWHNYGKDTIGARSDIEQVNIARLRAFYKNYYQPDNALLMVAGRFDQAKVLAQINERFGRIPKPKRVLAPTYTTEPAQDGERAVTVRRSGGTQYLGAGYHTAPSGHPDAVALNILNRILIDAPSGRLYKALVETKLATHVELDTTSYLEPGYDLFGAIVAKDGNLDAVQDAMLKALENLPSQPVTEEELARAKQRLLKEIDLTLADTANLTIALTDSMAAGDWRLFFLQRDQLEKIDLATVQAAAVKYFKTSNRTLGRFVPTDKADRVEVPGTPDVAAMIKNYVGHAQVAQGEAFDSSPANIEARTQYFSLPGGMKGALLPKKTKGGTVSLSLVMRSGTEQSLQGKAETGVYVTYMLMRGTTRLSRQQVNDAFDKLKTTINIGGSAEEAVVNLTTTRENLPKVLELLAEVLQKPSFPDAEFQKLQRARISRIEQAIPEPESQAFTAAQRLLDPTPEGHVRHIDSLPQQLAAAKAVSLENIKAFHADFYGSNNATVAAVGDFDPATLKTQLATLFGNWQAKQPFARVAVSLPGNEHKNITLETPDKANSMLVAVQALPLSDHADNFPALLMANHMLGGGALRSRLADRIRQKEGLSYSVQSNLDADPVDAVGTWLALAISAPQNNKKVEAALFEELQLALDKGFTEDELKEAKKGWRQANEVNRTQDEFLAGLMAANLKTGRTMVYSKELEDKVAALTVAQVNTALRQSLKPSLLSVVSAGDFAKVGKEGGGKEGSSKP
jgi:zinc protease